MRSRDMLMACVCALAGGCGSAPPRAEDHPPPDLCVSVTVINASKRAEGDLRGQRYILEPDGTLRALVAPGVSTSTYPPPVRRLRPDEVRAVWAKVRESGALEAPDASNANVAEVRPPAGGAPGVVLMVRADGRTRGVTAAAGGEGPGTELARVLGRLAMFER